MRPPPCFATFFSLWIRCNVKTSRRSARSVSISTFEESFPDEKSCKAHMFFHSAGLAHRCSGPNAARCLVPFRANSEFWCPVCGELFRAEARTIFRSTKIPVRTIFYAMLLMADLPGNASVGFLSRQLGISRKSAIGLASRIRLHMAAVELPRSIGGWGRPVWIDETFVRLQGDISSTCIFGMKDERSLSLHIVPDRRALTLQTLIEETVVSGSVLITDDFASYRGLERLGWKHHRLNHSKRMWSDAEGRSTASIDLVWRWLKRDLAGRTGQIAPDDLWKYIKHFLFKFHAQADPVEAYWRLVSNYPSAERYIEENLRREVDCRWRWPRDNSRRKAWPKPDLTDLRFEQPAVPRPGDPLTLPSSNPQRGRSAKRSRRGRAQRKRPQDLDRGHFSSPLRKRLGFTLGASGRMGENETEDETGLRQEPMKDHKDKPAEGPRVQVIDPLPHRFRQVQQMLARCGLSPERLQDPECIAQAPSELSLVFAPDTRDTQLERLFEICLERGHGLLLYAAAVERSRVVEMVGRGAQGYVEWPLAPEEVERNLEITKELGRQRIAFAAGQARARSAIEKLTRRETDVLAAVVDGLRNWEIAAKLGISKRTVEIHRANILAKLEIAGGAAVKIGVYAGLDQVSRLER